MGIDSICILRLNTDIPGVANRLKVLPAIMSYWDLYPIRCDVGELLLFLNIGNREGNDGGGITLSQARHSDPIRGYSCPEPTRPYSALHTIFYRLYYYICILNTTDENFST